MLHAASGSWLPSVRRLRLIRRNHSSMSTSDSSSSSHVEEAPVISPIAKYASCSRAHGSQKGTPLTSTTAGRRHGSFVLLRTLHCFLCLVVALIKRPSFLRCAFAAFFLGSTIIRRAYRVGGDGVSSKRRIFAAH